MGIFGTAMSSAATVLTVYKGDTRPLTREIKKLKGEEKKAAQARLGLMREANSMVDSQRAKLAKWGISVASVGAAYMTLREGVDAFVQDSRLQHAAMGTSIQGLQQASKGLISELDLMRLAAAGMNNGFGTTQKELEAVAGMMAELQHQGNDAEAVVRDLTKAVAEGGVEELQKFGVSIRNVNGQLIGKGQEGFNALVKRAAEESRNLSDVTGDETTRTLIELGDVMRYVKVEIGELTNDYIMPLVGGFISAAKAIRDTSDALNDLPGVGRLKDSLISGMPGFSTFGIGSDVSNAFESLDGEGLGDELKRLAHLLRREQEKIAEAGDVLASTRSPAAAMFAPGGMYGPAPKSRRRSGGRQTYKRYAPTYSPYGANAGRFDVSNDEESIAHALGLRDIDLQGMGAGSGSALGSLGPLEDLTDALGRIVPPEFEKAAEGPSLIEKLFGKPEEIDLLRSAFDSLAVSLHAGIDAWVLQGATAAESLDKMLKAVGTALSKELIAYAISWGKKSVGAFWNGNIAQGAGYALAASGALAGARQIGAITGSSSSGGAASVPGNFGGGGNSGPQITNKTYFVGESFEGESGRRRAARLRDQAAIGDDGSFEG